MTGQPFHEWLRARALAAGFDVDAAKGGRTALAEAAGMSVTQIGRTLEGKTTPSVESQRGLARALHVPFSEMLVRSGFATAEDFGESPEERHLEALSAEVALRHAAELLGVPRERHTLFTSLVEDIATTLRRSLEEREANWERATRATGSADLDPADPPQASE